MRSVLLTVPLLLLVGCSAAAAPAPTAAPASTSVAAESVPPPAAATEPAAPVEADQYWSTARLQALHVAKSKYKEPTESDAAPAAVQTAAVDQTVDQGIATGVTPLAPAAPAPAPVADLTTTPAPAPAAAQPALPTTPPTEFHFEGKVSDEDFFAALQVLVVGTEMNVITVEGLRMALEELTHVDLTPRQRRVLNDLIAEVDRVIASGPARRRDPRWDIDELTLPPVLRKDLPDGQTIADALEGQTK